MISCDNKKLVMAMAFDLIISLPGTAIRNVKNLSICLDSRTKAKLVSIMCNREIIVGDWTKFHHFKHGACSCKDYW